MKLHSREGVRRVKAGEVLAGSSETLPTIQFNPQEVLQPGDFELMTKWDAEKAHRTGMNLAVASVFFPDQIKNVPALKRLRREVSFDRPDIGFTKEPERMVLVVGMLKRFLPPDRVKAYAERSLARRLERSYAVDRIEDLSELLGLKMLLPEKSAQQQEQLDRLRSSLTTWLEHFSADLAQLDSTTLDLITLTFLAFPDLRKEFPPPNSFFDMVRTGLNFSRTHDPALQDPDIDSFTSVMFMATVLGNPFSRIDEQGNLVFTPPAEKLRGKPDLPDRSTI